jgi:hypothetical protein
MGIYTGYFDESSHEDDRYLVMGGIILDADNAADFDSEWRSAIKLLPLLNGEPFLHTADFVSGNEQYRADWKGRYDEKRAILSDAARVIGRHSLQVISCVLYMEDYRALDSIFKLSETLGHPYTMATRVAYQHMQAWAARNSITDPIKMVLEARNGTGDLVEMFRINGHPIPSAEGKGLPQLQAADYIAWMRLKRYWPNPSYEQVKASWSEINQVLYTDQTFGCSDMISTLRKAAEQHPDIPFPRRTDDLTLVTYNSNFKSPRRPFNRPAPVVRRRKKIIKDPRPDRTW